MKASLVKIGNSRGIRLPKPLIEQVGLRDVVELKVESGRLVISPVKATRAGWREFARSLHEADEDQLLDPPTPTRFDEEEWSW